MPRGGKRTGTPGTTYSNRTDLNQPVRTATGQGYGEAGAQAAAQQAVPLPQVGAPVGPQPGAQPFARPTDRASEPLTAGMPTGPGPGPSPAMAAGDPVLAALRSAYRTLPTDAIAALIEAAQKNGAT